MAQLARISVEISLVTKDQPYGSHPHKLVGNNCDGGVFTATLVGGQRIVR